MTLMINICSSFQTRLLNSNSTKSIDFYDERTNPHSRHPSNSLVKYRVVPLFLICFCFMAFAPNLSAVSQVTKVATLSSNLHKTKNLLSYLTKISPSNLFLKGRKPVNGLTYHYSNWNGKGGIQIFSDGEDVKMLSIIAITNAENLPHLKTPIPIAQLITDLLGNANAEWFIQSLSKLTSSKKELYSKDKQVALAYDQHVQKLTVTLRLL